MKRIPIIAAFSPIAAATYAATPPGIVVSRIDRLTAAKVDGMLPLSDVKVQCDGEGRCG